MANAAGATRARADLPTPTRRALDSMLRDYETIRAALAQDSARGIAAAARRIETPDAPR
jgi:hypothetical protein